MIARVVGYIDPDNPEKGTIWLEKAIPVEQVKTRAAGADETIEEIVNGVYSLRFGSPRGVSGIAKHHPLPDIITRNFLTMSGDQLGKFKSQAFLYPAGHELAGQGTVALMKLDSKGEWRPISWSSGISGKEMARVVMGQIDDSIKDVFLQPNEGRHKIASLAAEGIAERRTIAAEEYSKTHQFEEREPTEVGREVEEVPFLDWEGDKWVASNLMTTGFYGGKRGRSPRDDRTRARKGYAKKYGLGKHTIPRETSLSFNPKTGQWIEYMGRETAEETNERKRREKIAAVEAKYEALLIAEKTASPKKYIKPQYAVPFDPDVAYENWLTLMKVDLSAAINGMDKWVQAAKIYRGHDWYQETQASIDRALVQLRVTQEATRIHGELPKIVPSVRATPPPMPPIVVQHYPGISAGARSSGTYDIETRELSAAPEFSRLEHIVEGQKEWKALSSQDKVEYWVTKVTESESGRDLYAWANLSALNTRIANKVLDRIRVRPLEPIVYVTPVAPTPVAPTKPKLSPRQIAAFEDALAPFDTEEREIWWKSQLENKAVTKQQLYRWANMSPQNTRIADRVLKQEIVVKPYPYVVPPTRKQEYAIRDAITDKIPLEKLPMNSPERSARLDRIRREKEKAQLDKELAGEMSKIG